MDPSTLPPINAALNTVATVLLLIGGVLIKLSRPRPHRYFMIAAFVVSCLFLICYVTHKVLVGGAHTPYHGEGGLRTAYYGMLVSHVLLAMVVPFLAIWAIRLGLTEQHAKHRHLGHVLFPIWLYVSVSGVLIYLMLYHWNPA